MTDSLVIGASGLVGSELMKQLGDDAVGTYFNNPEPGLEKLDITDAKSVKKLINKIKPSVIYIPAAMTHVDYCESHEKESYAINVMGVKNIVDLANHASIVFFSSDYVFDGAKSNYAESDATNPLNVYGKHKLIAEHYIATNCEYHSIIRTSWVFGLDNQRKNFTVRLANNLKNGHIAKIPKDQFGVPTYAPSLVRDTIRLQGSLLANRWGGSVKPVKGIFNIVGPNAMTRFQYAVVIADTYGLDKGLVFPSTSEDLAVKRPMFGDLCNSKVEKLIGKNKDDLRQQLLEIKNEVFDR